ncbi:MAG: HIT family protein, partial [Ruminococcus sp.]|nr:HIT family protein [Ruminococcus sp.]
YTLFLCKQHVSEIFDLDPEFRAKHLTEMSLVAQAVSAAFPCDKMNYECLGNGESHVHWHLYPRRAGDLGEYGVNGKGPVWWLPVESRWWESDRIGGDPLEEMKAKLLSELNQLQ